jgi:hypothetical protein
MAYWTTTTYSCGHETDDRHSGHKSWHTTRYENVEGLCRKCEIALQAAEIKANLPAELPDLTGSPKQIDWALTIRHTLLPLLAAAAQNIRDKYTDEPLVPKYLDDAVAFVTAQSDASFWINNKHEAHLMILLIKIIRDLSS